MTVNIDKFLTPAEHAAEDHAGLDGVGNLSVSGTPAGTTDHSTLDHSSILGVGPDAGIRIFSAGATQAQVQAALNLAGVSIVYIQHSANISLTSALTIPIGKMLSGIGSQNAWIQFNGSGEHFTQSASGRILLSSHSRLKDLRIRATADWGSQGLVQVSGAQGGEVTGCYIRVDSASIGAGRYAIYFNSAGGHLVANCNIDIQGVVGNACSGINMVTGGNDNISAIRDTMVKGNSANNVSQYGINVAGHWTIDNCKITGVYHGVRFASQNATGLNTIRSTLSYNNQQDGFICTGLTTAAPTSVVDCYAHNNIGIGFNLNNAGTNGTGMWAFSRTRLNGSTHALGGAWAFSHAPLPI